MSNGHYYLHGDDIFLYINTGDNATPVFVEMDNAEEPTADMIKGESTRKPRVTNHELTRGGKFSNSFGFKYSLVDGDDAIFDMLWDSFINGTPIQLAMTTAPIAGTDAFGFKSWCEVMKCPLPGNAEEGVMIDIEAKPTDYVESDTLILPAYITPA